MASARKFAASILFCLAFFAIGYLLSASALPRIAIQAGIIGIPARLSVVAWGSVCVFAGAALWLAWEKGGANKEMRDAACLLAFQLVLAAAWWPAFFLFHSPFAGLLLSLPLCLVSVFSIAHLRGVDRIASDLLLPLLLWAIFLAFISYAAWQQQPLPACTGFAPENCPQQCSVCPPCRECPSAACQPEESCARMGFGKDWWESARQKK